MRGVFSALIQTRISVLICVHPRASVVWFKSAEIHSPCFRRAQDDTGGVGLTFLCDPILSGMPRRAQAKALQAIGIDLCASVVTLRSGRDPHAASRLRMTIEWLAGQARMPLA